jgi:predicted ATPase
VLIVGEPGLAKSRLIEEFHARLRDTPHTRVEWSCSQLLQNTPLHPIGEWGRARFGGADVPAERRLAELASSLAQVRLDPAENASLLAPLLDIPLLPERAPILAPEELRRRQLAALTNWVIVGAKVQPVVLAFEDLHWADPTTLDALRGIAERGALAPLFIVATTRPEFRPPWGMRSHHGTISLAPLDRAQVRDMVAELSARHALPRDVVEDVAARTGGVPLFVEEVTRLLLERGEQGGGIEAIPPTLQQSLMARLDRLGSAREVAQVGSVIGRGFSYGLLRDVAGIEDAALQATLEKLAEADIVLVQGLPPESDYRFKHALIQDAAYENLLKSWRQVLHRRVAETLRDRFAATAAAEPEALAYHFTQAGMTDAAIEWWGKAGDQALRRSALPGGDLPSRQGHRDGGQSREQCNTARRSRNLVDGPAAEIADHLQPSDDVFARLWRRGNEGRLQPRPGACRWDRQCGRAVQHLLRAVDRKLNARRVGFGVGDCRDVPARNGGWVMDDGSGGCPPVPGFNTTTQGDFTEAQAHLEEALRIYDPERDRDAKFRFGADTVVVATSYLASIIWVLGDVGRARDLIEEAVARAIESAHVPTQITTYNVKAMFETLRGDAEGARSAAETVVELSREHGLALYLTWGMLSLCWARARFGDQETGATELQQALSAYIAQGNKWCVPFYQGLLAEIEAEREGAEGALARIDEALALASETGEHWTDAFLHRIRGEILLKRDPANTAPAEEAFLTAIAIAREQKARSFELRAALSLAKLYQNIGRPADAHAVLAPALEGFSPTPKLPEIEEAQTLLAALAETDEVKNAAARANAGFSFRSALPMRCSRHAGSIRRKHNRRSAAPASWPAASTTRYNASPAITASGSAAIPAAKKRQ